MDNISIKSYLVGIGWFVLSLFTSSINDIISKYVGLSLNSFEVGFFRFLFATITLIPFVMYNIKNTLYTQKIFIHLIRGILLFLSMILWIFGLTTVHVTTATVLSFTVPLFVLVLALFFLKEKLMYQRWIATIIGFIGIVITLNPQEADFNPASLSLILSSLGFAMLDVINKRMLVREPRESIVGMLFYSSLIITLLAIPPMIYLWKSPTFYELILLFILGSSTNLMCYFILKAFSIIDITATAPYRYLELIISAILSYFILNEIPEKTTLCGAFIIIPSMVFIIYSEKNSIDKRKMRT